MNLHILSCKNGWIVTKHNYDQFNNVLSGINPNQPPQEQFIFTDLNEFIHWFKINFVLEKINQ